jgi:hypothetical protein
MAQQHHSGFECRLRVEATERPEDNEPGEREWVGYKTVYLPFVPRKGMRLGAVLDPGDDLVPLGPETIEDDDLSGWTIDLVMWDCREGRFDVGFTHLALLLPWDSTETSLAGRHSGWTFQRRLPAVEVQQEICRREGLISSRQDVASAPGR